MLLPAYNRFCVLEDTGEPDLVRRAMDSVWLRLESNELARLGVELPTRENLLDLMPQEDDWNEWAPQAEDAIGSLVLLRDLFESGDVALAVRIAERPYGGADELAAREMDIAFVDAPGRRRLLESPIVQRELQRQDGAIALLRGSPDRDASVLHLLRRTATESALGGD